VIRHPEPSEVIDPQRHAEAAVTVKPTKGPAPLS
jgi:hypothetical protein